MNKLSLSDNRLISLHQQKKLNAFFTLYNRYRNYSYAIIGVIFKNAKLFNALWDERDSIFYESLTYAIDSYEEKRGTFRNFLSKLVERNAIKCMREFQRDPISEYISMDAYLFGQQSVRYSDMLTFRDSSPTPAEQMNMKDQVELDINNLQLIFNRKIKYMIRMRQLGFSMQEIARHYHTTESAIRSLFYRVKKYLKNKK